MSRAQMARQLIRAAHHYRVPVSSLSRKTIRGAGYYALIQAGGIITGGPGRWSSPSYNVLRTVPGGPETWGIAAAVIGVLILAGSYRRSWWLKGVGMFLLSAWSFAFGIGAFISAFQYPGAGTTAPPIYLLVAYWCAALLWVDEGSRHAPQPHRRH